MPDKELTVQGVADKFELQAFQAESEALSSDPDFLAQRDLQFTADRFAELANPGSAFTEIDRKFKSQDFDSTTDVRMTLDRTQELLKKTTYPAVLGAFSQQTTLAGVRNMRERMKEIYNGKRGTDFIRHAMAQEIGKVYEDQMIKQTRRSVFDELFNESNISFQDANAEVGSTPDTLERGIQADMNTLLDNERAELFDNPQFVSTLNKARSRPTSVGEKLIGGVFGGTPVGQRSARDEDIVNARDRLKRMIINVKLDRVVDAVADSQKPITDFEVPEADGMMKATLDRFLNEGFTVAGISGDKLSFGVPGVLTFDVRVPQLLDQKELDDMTKVNKFLNANPKIKAEVMQKLPPVQAISFALATNPGRIGLKQLSNIVQFETAIVTALGKMTMALEDEIGEITGLPNVPDLLKGTGVFFDPEEVKRRGFLDVTADALIDSETGNVRDWIFDTFFDPEFLAKAETEDNELAKMFKFAGRVVEVVQPFTTLTLLGKTGKAITKVKTAENVLGRSLTAMEKRLFAIGNTNLSLGQKTDAILRTLNPITAPGRITKSALDLLPTNQLIKMSGKSLPEWRQFVQKKFDTDALRIKEPQLTRKFSAPEIATGVVDDDLTRTLQQIGRLGDDYEVIATKRVSEIRANERLSNLTPQQELERSSLRQALKSDDVSKRPLVTAEKEADEIISTVRGPQISKAVKAQQEVVDVTKKNFDDAVQAEAKATSELKTASKAGSRGDLNKRLAQEQGKLETLEKDIAHKTEAFEFQRKLDIKEVGNDIQRLEKEGEFVAERIKKTEDDIIAFKAQGKEAKIKSAEKNLAGLNTNANGIRNGIAKKANRIEKLKNKPVKLDGKLSKQKRERKLAVERLTKQSEAVELAEGTVNSAKANAKSAKRKLGKETKRLDAFTKSKATLAKEGFPQSIIARNMRILASKNLSPDDFKLFDQEFIRLGQKGKLATNKQSAVELNKVINRGSAEEGLEELLLYQGKIRDEINLTRDIGNYDFDLKAVKEVREVAVNRELRKAGVNDDSAKFITEKLIQPARFTFDQDFLGSLGNAFGDMGGGLSQWLHLKGLGSDVAELVGSSRIGDIIKKFGIGITKLSGDVTTAKALEKLGFKVTSEIKRGLREYRAELTNIPQRAFTKATKIAGKYTDEEMALVRELFFDASAGLGKAPKGISPDRWLQLGKDVAEFRKITFRGSEKLVQLGALGHQAHLDNALHYLRREYRDYAKNLAGDEADGFRKFLKPILDPDERTLVGNKKFKRDALPVTYKKTLTDAEAIEAGAIMDFPVELAGTMIHQGRMESVGRFQKWLVNKPGTTISIDDWDKLPLAQKADWVVPEAFTSSNLRGFSETDKNLFAKIQNALVKTDGDLKKAFNLADVNPNKGMSLLRKQFETADSVRGALQGTLMRREISDLITDFASPQAVSNIRRIANKFYSWWKATRTVTSARTQATNMISNGTFLMMGGVNPFKPESLQLFKRTMGGLASGTDDLVQEAIEHTNFLTQNFVDQVINGELKGSFKNIRDLANRTDVQSWFEANITNKGKSLYNNAEKVYQGADAVPKIMTYIKAREAGFTIREAQEHVGRWFPDYSRVPDWVRKVETVPFVGVPFISFQAEAFRIMGNAVKRPEMWPKMMALSAVGGYFNAGARDAYGQDFMDLKSWAMDSTFGSPMQIPMPFKDGKGRRYMWDFGRNFPFTDTLETMEAFAQLGTSAFKPTSQTERNATLFKLNKWFGRNPAHRSVQILLTGTDPQWPVGVDKAGTRSLAGTLATRLAKVGELNMPYVGLNIPQAIKRWYTPRGEFDQPKFMASEMLLGQKFRAYDITNMINTNESQFGSAKFQINREVGRLTSKLEKAQKIEGVRDDRIEEFREQMEFLGTSLRDVEVVHADRLVKLKQVLEFVENRNGKAKKNRSKNRFDRLIHNFYGTGNMHPDGELLDDPEFQKEMLKILRRINRFD